MKKYFFITSIFALIIVTSIELWRSDTASAARQSIDATRTMQNKNSFTTQPLDILQHENSTSQSFNEIDIFVDRWFEQVRLSERPEDLLMAGLLSKSDPADKEAFLLRAFEAMPDDLLLNYAIADFCGHNTHASLCAMVGTERLIGLDADNSFMWTTVANNAYRNGDVDGALRYLQQAGGSAEYNSQSPQLIQLIDDSLTYHGAERRFRLVSATLGIHAAQILPSHYSDLATMCREQTHWQDTCRGVGQTMLSQGRDAMDIAYGRTLAGHQSPNNQLPPIPAKWGAFVQSSGSEEQLRLIEILMEDNPRVADADWQEYLRLYEKDGAPAAYYYLVETLLASNN
jgi:hypothetical protein